MYCTGNFTYLTVIFLKCVLSHFSNEIIIVFHIYVHISLLLKLSSHSHLQIKPTQSRLCVWFSSCIWVNSGSLSHCYILPNNKSKNLVEDEAYFSTNHISIMFTVKSYNSHYIIIIIILPACAREHRGYITN